MSSPPGTGSKGGDQSSDRRRGGLSSRGTETNQPHRSRTATTRGRTATRTVTRTARIDTDTRSLPRGGGRHSHTHVAYGVNTSEGRTSNVEPSSNVGAYAASASASAAVIPEIIPTRLPPHSFPYAKAAEEEQEPPTEQPSISAERKTASTAASPAVAVHSHHPKSQPGIPGHRKSGQYRTPVRISLPRPSGTDAVSTVEAQALAQFQAYPVVAAAGVARHRHTEVPPLEMPPVAAVGGHMPHLPVGGDIDGGSAQGAGADVKAGRDGAEETTKTAARPSSSKDDDNSTKAAVQSPPPRGKVAVDDATDSSAPVAAAARAKGGQLATDPLPLPTVPTGASEIENNEVAKPVPCSEVVGVQAPPQVPSSTVNRDPPRSLQPRASLFGDEPVDPIQLAGPSADQQQRFGAVRVGSDGPSIARVGEGQGQGSTDTISPSRSSTENTVGTVRVVEARLVDQDDEAPLVETPPLVVATRADESTRVDNVNMFNIRNRRVQVVLMLLVATVAALSVGLGIALLRNDGDGTGTKGSSDKAASEGELQQEDEAARTDFTSVSTTPPSTVTAIADPTSSLMSQPATAESSKVFQRPSEVTPHQPTFLPTRSPTSPPTKSPPTSQPTLRPTMPRNIGLCLAQTLLPSDGSTTKYIGFGDAVGVSKSVVAVGAPYSDDNGDFSGSVSVYFRTGSGFTFQQKILPGDGAAGDEFGLSVAVDDNVIAVGAHNKDNNRGAVYIFVWDGSAWKERQKLVPQDSSEGDYFGYSVDLDKDRLIVGAPYSGRGKAYIFSLKGLTWEEEADLDPGDGASDDASFGDSVALRNGTALVGAPWDDTDKGTDSGSCYIYEYDASADASSSSPWKEAVKILPEDGSVGDKAFGNSVDLVEDGSKALIGADWDDSQGTSSGSAYLLVRGGSAWTEERKLLPKDGAAYEYFGRSAVLLSKSVAVVGADEDDDNGSNSGSLYLFIMEEDGGWTQKDKIVPADGEAGDFFGWSLAVDEGIVVVGADGADKAYVYELC